MADETEPYKEGVERILSRLRHRLEGRDVTLMEGATPDLPTAPHSVIVYDPSVPSRRSTGSPLLVTALCADKTVWPYIHEAFRTEGFVPMNPEPGNGRVCYASSTRALLIVPSHPGATRPADQTGLPLLTSIIR